MRVEEQVLENTTAIQQISDNAQDIEQLPAKSMPIVDEDLLVLRVVGSSETIKITKAELASAITFQADTNNYSSLLPPQLFNPLVGDVTAGFADFTLSQTNDVGFVTVNGQVIDDSEYGLVGSVLTVTPDNGFTDITDEVLVFQQSFVTVGTGGVVGSYRTISVDDQLLDSDYIVECTASLEFGLPTNVGRTGKIIIIKNSGTGVVNVDTATPGQTIEGEVTQDILPGDSWTLVSDGVSDWKLI